MLNKLNKYFLDIKPHFEKGGKYQSLYPLYEAFDSFLFSTTKSTPAAPHVRDAVDLKRIMIYVWIAAAPAILVGVWNTGHQANLAMSGLGVDEAVRIGRRVESRFLMHQCALMEAVFAFDGMLVAGTPEGRVVGLPFDLKTLEVTGEPIPVEREPIGE